MRKNKHIVIAFVLGAGFGALVAACFTHALVKRPAPLSSSLGEHTSPASVLDHHDYQLLIQKMATAMLKERLGTDDSTKPVISLGPIDNRTPFNIPVEMIGNEIRTEVMKSGLATFSTATDFAHKGGESGALYKQLKFQSESGHVDGATAKKYGQIVGADFILYGSIYSQKDSRSGSGKDITITMNMALADVANGIAVWSDSASVRKIVGR
jgi:penicillin-binding protein activator